MMSSATQQLTLRQPDDWHIHLRDGAMMRAVLPYTAAVFARAIIMPNLTPPITHKEMAAAYRQRITDALPAGMTFTPLMTLYLTDSADADDIEAGFRAGLYTAAKLYPAHATTNSAHGVTAIKHITKALEMMQHIGMPLLVHGEVTDGDVDVFDREKIFIDRVLVPLLKDFPSLKIVLEHITTRDAVMFIETHHHKHKLGATITPHHLLINRNAMFKGGMRPHYYCLPIVKREEHRQALVKAATSGAACFFLGTDSAPHKNSAKENACGCAGIFCAPQALELYAEVFESAQALDQLETFASINGPHFYGLPLNEKRITLVRADGEEAPAIMLEDGEMLNPFALGTKRRWRII